MKRFNYQNKEIFTMSEENKQTEDKPKFTRGSTLTIFKSDRHEDLMALVLSLLIALGVYFFVD
jgi:hypothetical protein